MALRCGGDTSEACLLAAARLNLAVAGVIWSRGETALWLEYAPPLHCKRKKKRKKRLRNTGRGGLGGGGGTRRTEMIQEDV